MIVFYDLILIKVGNDILNYLKLKFYFNYLKTMKSSIRGLKQLKFNYSQLLGYSRHFIFVKIKRHPIAFILCVRCFKKNFCF